MKIYLDMDGVLTDFEKEYERMFGPRPDCHNERHKHFRKHWVEFVTSGGFTRLDKHKHADELLAYVRSLNIPIEILSSSGGPEYHDIVAGHKAEWLKKNGIDYKANIVPGSGKKAEYAHPWHILIDDTSYVIDSYTKAGGTAILHHDIDETLKEISRLYLEWRGGQ